MFGDREIKLDLNNRGVVERGRKARPISKLATTLTDDTADTINFRTTFDK
jgi:hypothetical protein